MIQLIKYEWKKAFLKKTIVILMVIFIIIDLIKIVDIYHKKSYLISAGTVWREAYWDMYKDYNGNITDDKIQSLDDMYQKLGEEVIEMTASREMDLEKYMTGTVYSDYNFLDRYYITPFRYFALYQNRAEEICQRAADAASNAKNTGNMEEYRRNARIYHIFKDRKIKDFSYLENIELFLDFSFSDILVLLLVLYGLLAVYGSERDGNMESLLLTNKRGGKSVQVAKVAGAGLFSIMVSTIFSMVDYLGFAFVAGSFEGLKMPVYAIAFLGRSPLGINIFQYCLLDMAVRAFGFLIIGIVMLNISYIFKNVLASFFVGSVFCVCISIIYENCCHMPFLWLKILNPFSLVDNIHIFENTEFVSICGYPFPGWQIAIVIGGIYLVLLIGLALVVSKNNEYCR